MAPVPRRLRDKIRVRLESQAAELHEEFARLRTSVTARGGTLDEFSVQMDAAERDLLKKSTLQKMERAAKRKRKERAKDSDDESEEDTDALVLRALWLVRNTRETLKKQRVENTATSKWLAELEARVDEFIAESINLVDQVLPMQTTARPR